jgi:hypothetical protein
MIAQALAFTAFRNAEIAPIAPEWVHEDGELFDEFGGDGGASQTRQAEMPDSVDFRSTLAPLNVTQCRYSIS